MCTLKHTTIFLTFIPLFLVIWLLQASKYSTSSSPVLYVCTVISRQELSVRASACYLKLSPTLLNWLILEEVIWCYWSHIILWNELQFSDNSEFSVGFCWIFISLICTQLPVLPVWLNPKLHTSILSMLASCALHTSQDFGLSQQATEFITHCVLQPCIVLTLLFHQRVQFRKLGHISIRIMPWRIGCNWQ